MKVFFTTTVALLSIAATPVMAYAAFADSLYFTLDNQTSRTLVEFYLSPLPSTGWEENVLFSAVPQGSGGMIEVEDLHTCEYKILAVFADDVLIEDYDVNLCTLNTYTLIDAALE
ncbi:MAG: hypothetical protein HC873_16195 [Leptolyngbyaceae cyanobacterium SL_1_1]|nr:hypothetical protein [Leptolyngbyaceae cyanobacterium SL_1_1]